MTVKRLSISRLVLGLLIAIICSNSFADDSSTLLDLLRTGQFDVLEVKFNQFQKDYEEDKITEKQLVKEFGGLYSDKKEDQVYFDAWVKKYPDSYVSVVMRGVYFSDMAWHVRGNDFISKVSDENIREMERYLNLAQADFEKSRSHTRRPYYSLLMMLYVNKNTGSVEDRRKLHDEALKLDPKAWTIRRDYFSSILPRWGGSYRLMNDYLKECAHDQMSEVHYAALDAIYYADMLNTHSWRGDMDIDFSSADNLLKSAINAVNNVLYGLNPDASLIKTRDECFEQFEHDLQVANANDWKLNSTALQQYVYESILTDRTTGQEAALKMLLKENSEDGQAYGELARFYIRQNKMAQAWENDLHGAELGDKWSELSVGLTYYNGCKDISLTADHTLGLEWIKKAAAQGSQEATAFLKDHQS
jgi:hypothetical protein